MESAPTHGQRAYPRLKEGRLRSSPADSGRMDVERIAQASKAFGTLRKAIFLDKNLTLTTKGRSTRHVSISMDLSAGHCSGRISTS